MRRFFIDVENLQDDKIKIDINEGNHIANTLRLRPGDEVDFFDGRGNEYKGVLLPKEKGFLWARIVSVSLRDNMPALKLHLYQSLTKGGKMDYILQKSVELGVAAFTPVISRYSVVTLDERKAGYKLRRWREIAKAACKQCGRNTLMDIEPVQGWNEIMPAMAGKKFVVLYENEKKITLRSVIKNWLQEQAREVHLFVGPEGGYSGTEIGTAQECGGLTAGLGPRVLRTETAGLIAAGIMFYEWGDMDK
ncbi:MAG: 16S rRNA (uracil(1498)-N(3))-methyltransferase [Syntrophomonadaceae bacterium]|jgi:16S rRNA (uracil1498-N3)-methyltransferase|nr:16S rRNA (uracil(1498)-N(3))-methyltransferase [Syntrophomonadaceae bacterium]